MNDVVKQVLQTTPPCGKTEVYFGPEGTTPVEGWIRKVWEFKSSSSYIYIIYIYICLSCLERKMGMVSGKSIPCERNDQAFNAGEEISFL